MRTGLIKDIVQDIKKMKDRLTEHDNRFNSLSLHVQMYIGLGKTIDRPELTERVKKELREEQLNLLGSMTTGEISTMSEFIQWQVAEQQKKEALQITYYNDFDIHMGI